MLKRLYLVLVFAIALLLCACTSTKQEICTAPPATNEETHAETVGTEATEPTGTDATEPTHAETEPTHAETEPAHAETEPTQKETEPSAPAHSALYLPEYTPQQIQAYFEEVVLHMEYTDGTGNPALVQKWLKPIRYRTFGNPTEEDLTVLTALFTQLNEIPGFSGIHAAAEDESVDLFLFFLDPESFRAQFSAMLNGEDAYGATQFWYYTETNEIHTANIGYRTDIDQSIRTSILIEEIINTLGISDTVLREDSIVYQYSNDNTALSDVDWVILKLLYDPQIQCGMDLDSCRAIVQTLYY